MTRIRKFPLDHPWLIFWVFLFFLGVYLLTMKGYPLFADEEIMYESCRNLVEYNDPFTVPHPWITKRGRDGMPYSNYGIGQSLFEIPFYMAGRLVLSERAMNSKSIREILVYPAAPLTAAMIITVLFILAVSLGFDVKRAWILSLLAGFCTMLWPYSKMLFRDPLQTLLLLGAVTGVVLDRRHATPFALLGGGIFMACALTVKETLLLYVPFILLYIIWKRKRPIIPAILTFGVPVFAGGLLVLAYNYFRFGNLLDFGYTESNIMYGLSTPLVEGLYGQLLGTGNGFFIFNPLTWLLIAALPLFFRSHRYEALLFTAMTLTGVLFHSKYWTWGGGWAWGPRYLLVFVPFAILPLGVLGGDWITSRRNQIITVILIIAAVFVQIPGVLMHVAPYYSVVAHDVHLFPLTHEEGARIRSDMVHLDFVPQFSPIWGLYWSLKHALTMPFTDSAEIQAAMIADCPWRSISPDWVPAHPEKTIGMGLDLIGVKWAQTWPDRMLPVWVFYGFSLCLAGFALVKIRRGVSLSV